jgi:predicted lipid carrier protein YhbT
MPTLPRFTLPPVVAQVVSRLPAYPPAALVSAALDFGVGRAVSPEAVAPLQGKRFALTVRDLGLTVRFESSSRGFRPSRDAGPPDLAVTATLRDFVALALREEDPDTLFFARRLAIEGDTELGLTVKNLLDGIDWRGVLAALPLPFAASLRR